MPSQIHGMIIFDKPQGVSSQQAVTLVKKALQVKKAGHTGTLDPLATGVLPIALGEATKVIPFLDEQQKKYEVSAMLGIATDSYDADGEVTFRGDAKGVSRSQVEEVLLTFLGKKIQTPPIYSAIKVKGKALYRYARDGVVVEVPKREVTFHDLQLSEFNGDSFAIKVVCSPGTYIRSLINDIGIALGCFAHVTRLRRTQSGQFCEAAACSVEQLIESGASVETKVISLEECVAHYPKIILEDELELKRVLSGVPLYRIARALQAQEYFEREVALLYAGKLVAMIKTTNDGNFCYQRVFLQGHDSLVS